MYGVLTEDVALVVTVWVFVLLIIGISRRGFRESMQIEEKEERRRRRRVRETRVNSSIQDQAKNMLVAHQRYHPPLAKSPINFVKDLTT